MRTSAHWYLCIKRYYFLLYHLRVCKGPPLHQAVLFFTLSLSLGKLSCLESFCEACADEDICAPVSLHQAVLSFTLSLSLGKLSCLESFCEACADGDICKPVSLHQSVLSFTLSLSLGKLSCLKNLCEACADGGHLHTIITTHQNIYTKKKTRHRKLGLPLLVILKKEFISITLLYAGRSVFLLS